MKRWLIVAVLIFFFAPIANAREIKILFWYPGQAGSTEEAQPVLDLFCRYVAARLGPYRVTGTYFNTISGGRNFLKRGLPTIAIISTPMWTVYRSQVAGAVEWLATAPLPHGETTERYQLIGTTKTISAGMHLFTSVPFPEFIHRELFPNLPRDVQIEETHQLLAKLRAMGEGQESAIALLTPLEASTLAGLSNAWAKQLVTIATSPPIPTPRVILFDAHFFDAPKLKKILLGMATDKEAQDILAELQLKEFR